MFKLTIPKAELYNSQTNEFINVKEPINLSLEHSLVSISKWESKWKKSFLSTKNKTREETLDYIRCMTLNQTIPPEYYECISGVDIKRLNDYINDPMTATTFPEDNNKKGGVPKIITSEQIYSWMVQYGIPFECQKWHLARLMVLIRICAAANQPAKKMSAKELAERNRRINRARRAALHSKG